MKKHILYLQILLVMPIISQGQTVDRYKLTTDTPQDVVEVDEEEISNGQVYTIVEDMPQYPGGNAALNKYISDNLIIPASAKENGIAGTVYVSYVVMADGNVNETKVVRGRDPNLDKEALRVVNSIMGYKPGKQKGKPVAVQLTTPVKFVLE